MWVLMKVHWVGNTINSLRAASGIMMGLSCPTQSRFPRNYCHIKWICCARFTFIGQFAGRFGLGNWQWTHHLYCRTDIFQVHLFGVTRPCCLCGSSINDLLGSSHVWNGIQSGFHSSSCCCHVQAEVQELRSRCGHWEKLLRFSPVVHFIQPFSKDGVAWSVHVNSKEEELHKTQTLHRIK